jgi:hypothetical protein
VEANDGQGQANMEDEGARTPVGSAKRQREEGGNGSSQKKCRKAPDDLYTERMEPFLKMFANLAGVATDAEKSVYNKLIELMDDLLSITKAALEHKGTLARHDPQTLYKNLIWSKAFFIKMSGKDNRETKATIVKDIAWWCDRYGETFPWDPPFDPHAGGRRRVQFIEHLRDVYMGNTRSYEEEVRCASLNQANLLTFFKYLLDASDKDAAQKIIIANYRTSVHLARSLAIIRRPGEPEENMTRGLRRLATMRIIILHILGNPPLATNQRTIITNATNAPPFTPNTNPRTQLTSPEYTPVPQTHVGESSVQRRLFESPPTHTPGKRPLNTVINVGPSPRLGKMSRPCRPNDIRADKMEQAVMEFAEKVKVCFTTAELVATESVHALLIERLKNIKRRILTSAPHERHRLSHRTMYNHTVWSKAIYMKMEKRRNQDIKSEIVNDIEWWCENVNNDFPGESPFREEKYINTYEELKKAMNNVLETDGNYENEQRQALNFLAVIMAASSTSTAFNKRKAIQASLDMVIHLARSSALKRLHDITSLTDKNMSSDALRLAFMHRNFIELQMHGLYQ